MTDPLDTQELAGTYPQPDHGWICFFCGDTFKTYGAARDHFGERPSDGAACKIKGSEERGLVMALRKEQSANEQLRLKAVKNGQQIRQAEQAGRKKERERCIKATCVQCNVGRPLNDKGDHTLKEGGNILLPAGRCTAWHLHCLSEET